MKKKQIITTILGISALMIMSGCEKKPNADKMPYSEAIDVCGMIKDEIDFPSTFELERVDYCQSGQTGLIDYYWVEFSCENAYGIRDSAIMEFNYEGGVLKTVNDVDEESRQKSFDIFTDDGKDPDDMLSMKHQSIPLNYLYQN